METGIVSLKCLYDLVANNYPGSEGLQGRSTLGRAYGKAVKEATEYIQDQKGLYLWGKYERDGRWVNIYLGKAGFGKTANLRARIREELKDERCFVWRSCMTAHQILQLVSVLYPSMCAQYSKQWKRALRKEGSTHIVWVCNPELTNEDVVNIESDLIETLNPTANYHHRVPPKSLQQLARDIVGLLRSEVHNERDNRYLVRLI